MSVIGQLKEIQRIHTQQRRLWKSKLIESKKQSNIVIIALNRDIQTLKDGLNEIARYGHENDGLCPYGCDCPDIAIKTLNKLPRAF